MSSFPAVASIVEGEAPESDDEVEEVAEAKSKDFAAEEPDEAAAAGGAQLRDAPTGASAASARLSAGAADDAGVAKRRAVAYQQGSLLHAKFFQDASQLQTALIGRRAATYESATRGLRAVTGHLAKTHGYIQEVSHALRLTTNDLYKLEDRLRVLQSNNWLAGL